MCDGENNCFIFLIISGFVELFSAYDILVYIFLETQRNNIRFYILEKKALLKIGFVVEKANVFKLSF